MMCRKKHTQGIYSGEIRRKKSNAIDPGKEEIFDTKTFCKTMSWKHEGEYTKSI